MRAAAPAPVRWGQFTLCPPAQGPVGNLVLRRVVPPWQWPQVEEGERAGHLDEERREGDVGVPPPILPLGVIL